MKIILHEMTIREVAEGYVDNAEEGVVGYGGKLNIRPQYQREFVYKNKQRDAVITSVQNDFPLNVMYWVKNNDGFEMLDGQQRTISFCQYVNNKFSLNDLRFGNLQDDAQEKILNYKLMIYFCVGGNTEKLNWFEIVNIVGETLTDQEMKNAVYSGPWVSDAKRYFSKTSCPAYRIAKQYLNGVPIRQEYLETAIKWISDDNIKQYMSEHQKDKNATELWQYFQSVIDWIEDTFAEYHKEMAGLEWGRLYKKYHRKKYDKQTVSARVNVLRNDDDVTNNKGIFEYILGAEVDKKLLNVRFFDKKIISKAYSQQTEKAKTKEKSNCPDCALGHDVNKTKIWKKGDMDADHVKAWSQGGASDLENCEMLCKRHNRAKGNK